MNRAIFLKIGLAALSVLFVNPAAGQNERVLTNERACKAAVRERLDRMGVSPNNVRSISFTISRRGNRRSGTSPKGYNGWVRLNSCSGHLVMDLDLQCRVKRVYTKGNCKAQK